MTFAACMILLTIIITYSYIKIEKKEKLCKDQYDNLQMCLIDRYDPVEKLTNYIVRSVEYYQKPITGDFKQLRVNNRVRSYEIGAIEKYVTQSILEAIEIAGAEEKVKKGKEYEIILQQIQLVESRIYFALGECNRAREEYNEQLHNFPIILFAKFYGYKDKELIDIPLAYYDEKGTLNLKRIHEIRMDRTTRGAEQPIEKKKRGRPKKKQ